MFNIQNSQMFVIFCGMWGLLNRLKTQWMMYLHNSLYVLTCILLVSCSSWIFTEWI